MPRKEYSSEELERLHSEFVNGSSALRLEKILRRSGIGIALKLLSLSEEDSENWDRNEALKKYKEFRREYYRGRIVNYLIDNPEAMAKDLIANGHGWDLGIAYNGRINDAKRDAGIIPKGYISAAEAARQLNTSRSRISSLFNTGKLNGCRIGKSVFICLAGKKKNL